MLRASPGSSPGGERYDPPGHMLSSVATLPVSRVVHTAAAARAAADRPPSTVPGGASRNDLSCCVRPAKRVADDMASTRVAGGRDGSGERRRREDAGMKKARGGSRKYGSGGRAGQKADKHGAANGSRQRAATTPDLQRAHACCQRCWPPRRHASPCGLPCLNAGARSAQPDSHPPLLDVWVVFSPSAADPEQLRSGDPPVHSWHRRSAPLGGQRVSAAQSLVPDTKPMKQKTSGVSWAWRDCREVGPRASKLTQARGLHHEATVATCRALALSCRSLPSNASALTKVFNAAQRFPNDGMLGPAKIVVRPCETEARPYETEMRPCETEMRTSN